MWSIGFENARPECPMGAFDLLGKARELGLQVVQYGPNLDLAGLPESDLNALVSQALDWNIEIEVGTRGLETEHLRRYIRFAKRVGATLLRSVPELADGRIPPASEIVAYLRAISSDLEEAGIRLAFENARIPAEQLSSIIDMAGSDRIGVTLDTVNSLAVPEGTEHVARTLARHTMCLHVKDFAVSRVWHMMGFTVEGRPAGKGQLDVPWLIALIRREGRAANAILELWPPEQRSLAETISLEQRWAAESIAYLRQHVTDGERAIDRP